METLQKLYRLQAYKADRVDVEEVEELVVEVVVDDGVGGGVTTAAAAAVFSTSGRCSCSSKSLKLLLSRDRTIIRDKNEEDRLGLDVEEDDDFIFYGKVLTV